MGRNESCELDESERTHQQFNADGDAGGRKQPELDADEPGGLAGGSVGT